MKNRMPNRKSLKKISSFLRSLKRKNNGHSPIRFNWRNPLDFPNSSKIGAGKLTARRNLPMDTLHKRDHRSNVMIGVAI